MDAAAAELWLVTLNQRTAEEAHRLGRAARRIAVAAASGDRQALNQKMIKFAEVERSFVNQARQELGITLVLSNPYKRDAELP
jgi:hypothetical protein